MNFTELASVPPDPAPFTDQLRLAVAAYLARFKGSSREHTESDLRCYLAWCAERALDPLAARRPHLELHIRWIQEIRRFQPSTVSRRISVTAGFDRTCVIDGLLEHSPAEPVRRPSVSAESPTLGFTHLQFEALLTAGRESPNPYDFALVVMLGLFGLRIFEATRANIVDLGEEHGHRVLRVCGKGTKIVLAPLPPVVGGAIDQATGPRTHGPILLNSAIRAILYPVAALRTPPAPAPRRHRPATPPGHRRWHKDNLSPGWAVVMCCDSPVEEKCAGNFPGWSASLPAEGVCSGAIVRQPRLQTAWSGDPSVDAVTYLPRRLSRCDQDWLAPAVRGWRKQ